MTSESMKKGPGNDVPSQKWTSAQPRARLCGNPFRTNNPPIKSANSEKETGQGYAEHVVATVSEWLVAFVTIGYFATFYTEFKHFRMKPPEAVYYNQEVSNKPTQIAVIT